MEGLRAIWTLTFLALLTYSVEAKYFSLYDEEVYNACPKDNITDYNIEHPFACNLWYTCDGTTLVKNKCPSGSYFNISSSDCDIPSTEECVRPNPCIGINLGAIWNPLDCSMYLLCDQGKVFIDLDIKCFVGKHFSELTTNCADPEEANCYWYLMSLTTTTETTPVPTTQTTQTTTPETTTNGGICQGDHLHYVPHPTDCSLYYICDDTFPIEMACKNGTHFSVTAEKCMDPWLAGCEEFTTVVPTTTTEAPRICENTDVIELVPYPDDCTKYYICVFGVATESNCKNGTHFSPTELICLAPEEAMCEEIVPICPNNELQYVPFPGNCSLYYICDQGDPRLVNCKEGLHFSLILQKCVSPNVARCEDFVIPNTTTTSPNETTTEESVTTTEIETTTEELCTSTPEPTDITDVTTNTTPEITTEEQITTTPEEPISTTPEEQISSTTEESVPTTPEEPETDGTTTAEPATDGTTTTEEPETDGTTTTEEPETDGTTTEEPITDGTTTTEEPETDGTTTTEEPETDGTTTTEEPETEGTTTTEEPETDGTTTDATDVPTEETTTEGVTVTTPVPVTCPPTGIHYKPDPTNCANYYRCVDGIPQLMHCADGLHWHEYILACVPPEIANCQLAKLFYA